MAAIVNLKIAVVGGGGVGKSCLTIQFGQNQFMETWGMCDTCDYHLYHVAIAMDVRLFVCVWKIMRVLLCAVRMCVHVWKGCRETHFGPQKFNQLIQSTQRFVWGDWSHRWNEQMCECVCGWRCNDVIQSFHWYVVSSRLLWHIYKNNNNNKREWRLFSGGKTTEIWYRVAMIWTKLLKTTHTHHTASTQQHSTAR